MILLDHEKARQAVTQTDCKTPVNTTYNKDKHLWQPSSGNLRETLQGFIYGFNFHDPANSIGYDGETGTDRKAYIQLHTAGAPFSSSSATPFTRLKRTKHQVGEQVDDFAPTLFDTADLVDITTTNFDKLSYSLWNGLDDSLDVWAINDAGTEAKFINTSVKINKITDRIYFDNDFVNKVEEATLSDYLNSNGRIIIGKWYGYNNKSFWAYVDSSGSQRIKPVGTSSQELKLSDGTVLKDDPTNFFNQTVQTQNNALNSVDPTLNPTTNLGTGWSASGTTYVGVDAGTDNFYFVDNVAENIEDGKTYIVKAKFVVTSASGSTTLSDCGWSEKLNDRVSNSGIPTSSSAQTEFGTSGFRLKKTDTAGTYILGGLVRAEIPVGYTLPAFSIFKHKDAAVTVSDIEVTPFIGADVRIQPLVFSPKPDYEVGDVIEMTNKNKTPTGGEVKVKVELLEEINTDFGEALPREIPLTWDAAHTISSVGDIINVSNFSSGFTTDGSNITAGSTIAVTAGATSTIEFDTANLVSGNYYEIRYTVDSSNFVDDGTTRVYLFDNAREDGTDTDHHVMLHGSVDTHRFTFLAGGNTGTTNKLKLGFDSDLAITISDLKISTVTQTKTDIEEYGENADRKIFHAKIRGINNDILTLNEEDRTEWTCKLLGKESFYDLIFPRFAYRWKYADGEYSAVSAFTEAAFLPGNNFEYDSKESYNLAMVNRVNRVELNNFEHIPKDVVEIDILYKESNSPIIYVLRTIKDIDKFEDEDDKTVVITKRQIKGAIESNQLLRPFDNVPKKALAQEITANRLTFGNYTHQYDVSLQEEPDIFLRTNSILIPEDTVAKSIKSGRNYQIGAAWLDDFGRQTPVFTNKDCLKDLRYDYADSSNSFSAVVTNKAPSWATHYKYYVKDPAGEYYNIALDRYYQGEEQHHIWLSFPSKDRNKVDIDDYLILKKSHTEDLMIDLSTGQQNASGRAKYKIIAIENEAPDHIRVRRESIGGRVLAANASVSTNVGLEFFSFTPATTSASGVSAGSTNWPAEGRSTVFINGNDIANRPALKDALLESQVNRYVRFGKRNSLTNSTMSAFYEVLSVRRTEDANNSFDSDGAVYEISFASALGSEINSIFGTSAPSTALAAEQANIFFEYFKEVDALGEAEFNGRFFVKILKDETFVREVSGKNIAADAGFTAKLTVDTNWIHAYDTAIDDNTLYVGGATGTDADTTLLKKNLFKWSKLAGQWNDTSTSNYLSGPGDGVYNGAAIHDWWEHTSTHYQSSHPGYFHETFSDTDQSPHFYDKIRVNDGSGGTENIGRVSPGGGTVAAHTNLAVTQNPYTANWSGTQNQLDFASDEGAVNLAPQKFCIDQAWSFGELPTAANFPNEATQLYDTATDNHEYGRGFVSGNNFCSFRFICFGNYKNEGGDKDDDYNDFLYSSSSLSNSGQNFNLVSSVTPTVTASSFDNNDLYELYVKLTTPGTRFRWLDDPGQTVYTIKATQAYFVRNFKNNSVNFDLATSMQGKRNNIFQDGQERENMGMRINMILEENISYSPTTSGLSELTSANVASGASIASKIEIVEPVTGSVSYSTDNPAVFEVEPKETTDLNLFYETCKARMIIKDGMKIELINNDNVNDSGLINVNLSSGGTTYPGNYKGPGFAGTVYNPSGSTNGTALADNATIATSYVDAATNKVVKLPANQFIIPAASWSVFDLPRGLTVRITSTDANGNDEYFREFLLPTSIASGDTNRVVLPFDDIIWHNCWSFGNGVESDRIRDDFNAVTLDKGARVSTTLDEPYAEENRKSGLIYSGIYNSQSGTNRLNQFIMAEKITKSLNPEYGSIQKLFTRNYDLIAFCEDKVLKVLASKDALFNADGNMQLTATNKVLGQAVPFVGEFGISKNPESFADYGYRAYFSDKSRGVTLRLSQDGITVISDYGMSNYFKTTFAKADTVLGSYDEDKDVYNITLDGSTISFTEKVNGWTSFKSFLPESGLSLNGVYFTFKNGDIWKHNVNDIRNNFYSVQYDSSIKFIFNDQPDAIKSFNTLNYEGTQAREYETKAGEEDQIIKKGWYSSSVESNAQSGQVPQFKEKEGKWYNNIVGVDSDETNIDPKEFTSQGLGFVTAVGRGDYDDYKTLTITAKYPQSVPTINLIGANSAAGTDGSVTDFSTPSSLDNGTAAYTEDSDYDSVTGWEIQSATQARWQGVPSTVVSTSTGNDINNYFLTKWATNLVKGNTYFISADLTDVSGANLVSGGPAIEIDSTNMTDFNASTMAFNSGTSGKIFTSFTYNPDSTTEDFGILIGKNNETSGVLSNLSIVNTTNQLDNVKFTVNTSATDRTSTDTTITTQKVEGSVFTQNITFYIHSQIVRGVKYGLTAAHFTSTASSNITNITLADLGTAGFFDNIVKVTATVQYTTADPFPLQNEDLFIQITANAGAPAIATDQ